MEREEKGGHKRHVCPGKGELSAGSQRCGNRNGPLKRPNNETGTTVLACLFGSCIMLSWVVETTCDRAGQALFFDGAQFPFNTTSPPSPGMVYITPRRTPPTAAVGPWFEYDGSFSIQFWMRPIRVFVGTDVEGGLVGCLVRQTAQGSGGIRAGYGLTITSDSQVRFIATVGAETGSVSQTVEVNQWTHITAVYDASTVTSSLYYSLGTGEASVLAGSYKFDQIAPSPINFNTHNDLILGKFQPLYDAEYYYSGYLDELRFWSIAMTQGQIATSLYRTYAPDSITLATRRISGYWPMNAVVCTESLCDNVASLQQWMHAGGTGRFTSSLILKASPLDTSAGVAGLDCRSQQTATLFPSCICNEFDSIYCWDSAMGEAAYCDDCPGCPRIRCYGPYGAPKCLTVQGGVQLSGGSVVPSSIELNACIDGSTAQKWTKFATEVGQMQLADYPLMCLAAPEVGPFRGATLRIEQCIFDVKPGRQLWSLDRTTLALKNPASGMCVTSSAASNGALPYLVDCIELAPLFSTEPLKGFVFDFALGHNGALIGGVYLSNSDKCSAVSQCSMAVKAPIDQPPRITHVDGLPITEYVLRRSGTVNEAIDLSMSALDPNQNDQIQFEFLPYDRNLVSDPSVTWPPEYSCSGGSNNGGNCSCLTSSSCTVCEGGGTCVRNPSNPCPANPCTRTFRWLPTLATLFSNPTTFIFTVTDNPTNEYDGLSAASPQSDVPLQAIISVSMPPEFVEPSPPYDCLGGTASGTKYPAKADCIEYCQQQGSGVCRNPDLYVSIGNFLEFTIKAANRQPGSIIEILVVSEGPGGIAPPEARVVVTPTLPTVSLITDGAVLKEVSRYNPVIRVFKFTPNAIDAKRTYQQCFIALNPNLPFAPATQTEVKCINIHVLTTSPIFDSPSPANDSTLIAHVGCPLLFTMTALKNDTAQYDLLVSTHSTAYRTFAGKLLPVQGLPVGAIFNTQETSDVKLVYALQWTPEVGQEGTWQLCFSASDSLQISSEVRCVFVDVQRCLRCVRPGDTLEYIGQMYNAHWLELYAINPSTHTNPSRLQHGALVSVGVMYRTPKTETLTALAKYLHVTPSAIRRLNPDIQSDFETVDAFRRICVLPAVCGNICGNAAYCDRVQIEGGLL